MFFRRKNQEAQYQALEDQIAALAQDTAAANQKLESLNSLQQTLCQLQDTLIQHTSQLNNNMDQHTSRLENNISQLHSDVHKHDMALEDLLDEWEDKKSDEESIKARLLEADQTERLLLELFSSYQEQFWNLKHFALSKDEAWATQIALMEKTLEQYRRSCAISLIQECNVSVDYGLHDVIEAVDTTDPALDKTVAQIYRCGYLYKGKVRKKAQVSAYRLSTQKTELGTDQQSDHSDKALCQKQESK